MEKIEVGVFINRKTGESWPILRDATPELVKAKEKFDEKIYQFLSQEVIDYIKKQESQQGV